MIKRINNSMRGHSLPLTGSDCRRAWYVQTS
jgi:hypothetical protein